MAKLIKNSSDCTVGSLAETFCEHSHDVAFNELQERERERDKLSSCTKITLFVEFSLE